MARKLTYEELERKIKKLELDAEKHKEVERRLDQQAQILSSIKDTIVIVTREMKTIYANQTAKDLFGDRQEMFTEPCYRFFKNWDTVCENCPVLKTIQDEKPHNAIMKSYDKNDQEMWRFNTAFPFYDLDGQVIAGIEIVTDYTPQKRAEMALQQSEDRYRALFENMMDGVSIYEAKNEGEDFTLIDFNKAGERIDNIHKDALIGKSVLEVFPAVKDSGLFDVFNRVWKTGKPVRHPVAVYKDEREAGWKDNFVYKLPSGEIVAIYSDETDRKRAEEALRESKIDLDKAQRIAHVGSWSRDLKTDQGKWSDEMYRMLGFSPGSPENPTREDFLSRVHPADRERVSSVLKDAIKKKESFDFEFQTVPIEGWERIFREVGQVECNETGTPVRIFGTAQDITEQRRLQAHLRETRKMEAIATLAGGIAHQFNNALTTIIGNIDLLEMDHREDDAMVENLKDMKASGHRMAHLTSQLLAYARGGRYNVQTLSLAKFAIDTIPLIKHTLNPEVRVETDLPPGLSAVKADPTQIQMVLSALMSNSNEAIEGPGRIRISTKNMELDQEFIKNHPGLKPGPYICLSIEDDGKGMDDETKDRIFEPFFTTHFIGRGLGMPAAYGIVKNHSGAITVDSELGKGTVVKIYLPAVEEEEEVDDRVVSEPKVELAGGEGTILVIEDEEPLLKMNRQIVERLGYRVLEARNGQAAVEIANTFDGQIDLALLDIKLPDIPGDKVYPLIMEARPNLKVIVCSGYAIDGPAQEILDAGAQAFIQKPFLISTLAEKLKEVLGGK